MRIGLGDSTVDLGVSRIKRNAASHQRGVPHHQRHSIKPLLHLQGVYALVNYSTSSSASMRLRVYALVNYSPELFQPSRRFCGGLICLQTESTPGYHRI